MISPGPGRPDRVEDFGVSANAILESNLPVLGVCLGHQGIAHFFGGKVSHAPEPMHGRISEVWHEGIDIFSGLPSPLSVVRYHSLVVTELSDSIEKIAWTQDDLIMGIRHRTLPIWGVQFHPESICSEYGRELLKNFRDLTPSRPKKDERPMKLEGKSSNSTENKIHVRKLSNFPDAQSSYKKLFADAPHAFWLDSSAVIDGLSRFSYLGDGTGENAEYITYQIAEGRVKIQRSGKVPQYVKMPFFDYLDEQLIHRATPKGLPFDFNLGYVGYIGYELKAETCGSSKYQQSEVPDAALLFVDRMLVLDHLKREAYLLCLSKGNDLEAITWIDNTELKLSEMPSEPLEWEKEDAILLAAPNLDSTIELRHDREFYLQLIDECLEEIRNGESYEICLTNTATIHTSIDPWITYTNLRRISPVPYGAFLNFPEVAVLSASPERFLYVDTNHNVESKPIKGTRRRGNNPKEDKLLCEELLNQEKDRAENLMIVDLVRNDLNNVCTVGSVHVPKLFNIETYAPVHQLISTIRGTIRPEKTTIDCVRVAFPGGSMTGAPKMRTMEIIDRLENGPRGIYSGTLGWFALNSAADLSIVIRTIVITEDKATLGVGGAIVSQSDPVEEFEETLVKGRAMISAINMAVTQHREVHDE